MATPSELSEEDNLTITDHNGLGDGDVLIEDGTMEFLDSVISGEHKPEGPTEEEIDVPSGDVESFDEDTVQPVKPNALQPQPAEATAKIKEEEDPDGSDTGPSTDRKRAYLGHITDPVTLQAIQLIEANPKLSLAKAEELAKQALGIDDKANPEDDGTVSYDDLPLAEKINFDTSEFNEISQQIIEKERLGIHDDEWETLVGKKDQLGRTIAKNELRLEMLSEQMADEAKIIAENQEEAIKIIEATEEELSAEFPDLIDEDSLLYAAVSQASNRMMSKYAEGNAPDWFKPTSPESMKRIVQEQHERITGKKTPVAKPGVAEVSASAHRSKGPVPAKPTHAVAQLRSIPGSTITTSPQIVASGSDDDFLASLDDVIAGKTVTRQRGSSAFEIV